MKFTERLTSVGKRKSSLTLARDSLNLARQRITSPSSSCTCSSRSHSTDSTRSRWARASCKGDAAFDNPPDVNGSDVDFTAFMAHGALSSSCTPWLTTRPASLVTEAGTTAGTDSVTADSMPDMDRIFSREAFHAPAATGSNSLADAVPASPKSTASTGSQRSSLSERSRAAFARLKSGLAGVGQLMLNGLILHAHPLDPMSVLPQVSDSETYASEQRAMRQHLEQQNHMYQSQPYWIA